MKDNPSVQNIPHAHGSLYSMPPFPPEIMLEMFSYLTYHDGERW